MDSRRRRCNARAVPCYDAQLLREFSNEHRGEDRRMRPETSEALVRFNHGFELLDEPGHIADIRAILGAEGKFGYEQVEARATWVGPARRALYRFLIQRDDGRVTLAVHYGVTADLQRSILRLVDVKWPHLVVDCAALDKLETVQDALARLLQPLLDLSCSNIRFTVVEAARVVVPATHPLRRASENVEYAIRAADHDSAPKPQLRPTADQHDRVAWTMAEVIAAAGQELVPTYSLSGVGRREMVAAVDELDGAHLLLKPSFSGDPAHSGAKRMRRACALREIAVAAATREEYAGDQRPLTHFIARQKPLALEHLSILRGLLAATASWAQR